LPVTALPSCCPFVPALRLDFPGRSVIQTLINSRRIWISFRESRPKSFFSEALWPNRWKNVSGFLRSAEHREPRFISSDSGSPGAQSRRSEWIGLCFN
jgi:hypothetical protein